MAKIEQMNNSNTNKVEENDFNFDNLEQNNVQENEFNFDSLQENESKQTTLNFNELNQSEPQKAENKKQQTAKQNPITAIKAKMANAIKASAPQNSENKPKEKGSVMVKGKKVSPLTVFAIITLICFVFCAVMVFSLLWDFFAGVAQDVELPNFDGMSITEIQNNPDYNSFKITYEEVYSEDAHTGIVISQTPKAPQLVKDNAKIILRYSVGATVTDVPYLTGKTREEAKEIMKTANLNVMFKPVVDNTIENDTVLYSDPASGQKVNEGDTVVVYVSRDDSAMNVLVPNCVGQTSLVEAVRLLSEAGLQYELAEGGGSDGQVTMQDPVSNTSVPRGSIVKLTLSGGSENTGLDTLPQMQVSGADGHLHVYTPVSVVAPNSYSIGYTIYSCSICGYFYYGDFTQPVG